MWLLWAALALTIGRYFELGPLANLSWWWVVGAYAATLLWFEVFEKLLGLEKKKAINEMEATRKARIERALKREPNRRRR